MTSHDTTVLLTNRLVLTPLEPSDAFEMVDVLADSALYTFTGGEPPGFAQLDERYKSQVAGPSDPGEQWHNWIIRIADSHSAAGFVQATVTNDHADVAWVVGMHWQHNGIAREAAAAMCRWLVLAAFAASPRTYIPNTMRRPGWQLRAACSQRARWTTTARSSGCRRATAVSTDP